MMHINHIILKFYLLISSTKVIRKHQPHTFLGFKERLLDKKSIKYADLIQYKLMGEIFKKENKELLARIEVLESDNNEKLSELESLLWSTERSWSLNKIVESRKNIISLRTEIKYFN
ncbi:Uncharacterised protein [Mycoplasmopsis bovirhinis]|uniref:Uncharacterized protein n=2 Tax=Mycoplasmopsis bovirhinis TaxID=29553 RepID=A0A449AEC0_9BACT|nr:Uncharacterised protein [Mycoplasmopsis bovirhinis]